MVATASAFLIRPMVPKPSPERFTSFVLLLSANVDCINRLMFSARIWREEVRVPIPGMLPSSLSLPDPNETDFLSFVACLQCAFIASFSLQPRREDTGISFYSN